MLVSGLTSDCTITAQQLSRTGIWPGPLPTPQRKAAARVALRELRDEETANVLKQQSLVQAIEEAQGIISTSSGLLQMYCNRCVASLPGLLHEPMQPARDVGRSAHACSRTVAEGRPSTLHEY